MALQAGGLDTSGHPVSAGDYGPFLERLGAVVVPNENYVPQAGDIAVFARNAAHPHGHIQIYDGNQWISDFKQRNFNPYKDPKSAGPHKIYRFIQ
jgi:hypothetical protein